MWSILNQPDFALSCEMRNRLFQGECAVLKTSAFQKSESLKRALNALRGNLEEQLDCSWDNIRNIHLEKSRQSFWETRQLMHQTWLHPSWKKRWKDLFSCLLPPEEFFVLSRPSLRICIPGGENQECLKNAYTLHRDTWYGYPASTINIWIPLHEVDAHETFEIYPNYFDKPVHNSSSLFDWRSWKKTASMAHYPTAELPQDVEVLTVQGEADQLFIFSAQHLHRTTPHAHPQTRFSLDVRLIVKSDVLNQFGAPMKDNASPPIPLEMLDQ